MNDDVFNALMSNPAFETLPDRQQYYELPMVLKAYIELLQMSKKELQMVLYKQLVDAAPNGVAMSLRKKKDMFIYALLCAIHGHVKKQLPFPSYHSWRMVELRKRVTTRLGMNQELLKQVLYPHKVARMTYAQLAVLMDLDEHQNGAFYALDSIRMALRR